MDRCSFPSGLALLVAALLPGPAPASDIAATKHNLSASGPGTVKAEAETRICVFCHTPHNASPDAQLWNRNASAATYAPYASTSMDASPGQPTGGSKLCLSCHDGTIALGDVLSEASPIAMAGGVTTMPAGDSNLGTVLLDDHPVSFQFTSGLAAVDGQLVDPAGLTGDVKLDEGGELQCLSCHDPHDDTYGHFLVLDNTASAICRACHDRTNWDSSTHRSSTATWNGAPPDPWPHTDFTTVADNACESCHDPHGAGGAERLMNHATEELNCLACHNGNVAGSDLETEFGKPYVHPIANTVGIHDSEEGLPVTDRHVECVDCHEPHSVEGTGAVAPAASGRLKGVRGVDGAGSPVAPLVNEYEACYKCHADSPGMPGPKTPRQIVQDNVRLEFDPSNPSFHPVESAGVNPNVPSLMAPYTTASVLYCTDCHTNDSGPRAGGVDPEGPHGSTYPTLLGWQYETADNVTEGPTVYELCYRCHDRASILADESFGEHKRHIRNENASCNICHDPHGISAAQGSATNHSRLINFDTSVVIPDPNTGRLEFVDKGLFSGECSLKCHNKRHDRKSY